MKYKNQEAWLTFLQLYRASGEAILHAWLLGMNMLSLDMLETQEAATWDWKVHSNNLEWLAL